MADRTVRVTLSAVVSGFTQGMGQAAKSVQDATKAMEAHSAALDKLGTMSLAAGAVLAAGIGVAVKSYADFEQAMSNVAATGQNARDNFSALSQAALDAGAATKFSATEAAQGIEELAKAGMSASDILNGGLTGALSLAAAGNMSVADAAELSATALAQFGLDGSQASHVADLLAAGAGKAQGEVSDMGMALKQGGLVAAQFGLSIEETTGSLAAFANAGLVGSDAGTSLKTMLLALATPSSTAAKEMERLGINAYDAQGKFIGLEGLAGVLQQRLGGLTDAERQHALGVIFGSDAMRAASVLYKEGAAGIGEWVTKTNDAGYAAVAAATKMNNLKGDLENLRGSLETALIKAGSQASGALRGLAQAATGAVNVIADAPPAAQQLAMAIGAIGASSLIAVGSVAKIATAFSEFKGAITGLGVSMSTATLAMGAIGVAITIAGLAIGSWLQKQAEAKQAAEQFALTLDQQTGAITNSTRAMAFDTLAKQGAIDAAKQLGISVYDLTSASLGQADAQSRVQAAVAAANGSLSTQAANYVAVGDQAVAASGTQVELSGAIEKVTTAVGFTNSAVSASKQIYADKAAAVGTDTQATLSSITAEQAKAMAMGDSGRATSLSAIATQLRTGAITADTAAVQAGLGPQEQLKTTVTGQATGFQAATTAVTSYAAATEGLTATAAAAAVAAAEHAKAEDTLATMTVKVREAIVAANQAQIALSGTAIGLESAIAGASQAVDENGKALDITTKAGRANRTALDQIAAAANTLRAKQLETNASTEEMTTSTNRAREAFIRTATQMGMNRTEAEKLADQYGLIPPTVVTSISQPGMSNALSSARQLLADLNSLNGRTFYYNVKANGDLKVSGGTMVAGAATGGYITGPGTATSDSILARLSNGEFVQRTAAVDYYGVNFMHALNALQIPKDYFSGLGFAGGGYVQPPVHYSSAIPRYATGGPVSAPVITLDSTGIEAAIQRGLAGAVWMMDGRVIDVRLAEVASDQLRASRAYTG